MDKSPFSHFTARHPAVRNAEARYLRNAQRRRDIVKRPNCQSIGCASFQVESRALPSCPPTCRSCSAGPAAAAVAAVCCCSCWRHAYLHLKGSLGGDLPRHGSRAVSRQGWPLELRICCSIRDADNKEPNVAEGRGMALDNRHPRFSHSVVCLKWHGPRAG